MTRPVIDLTAFTAASPQPRTFWHGGVRYLLNPLVLGHDETFSIPEGLTDKTEALRFALVLTEAAGAAQLRLMELVVAHKTNASRPRIGE